MKIRKMTVIAAIAVAGIINASCGNKQQQANSEGATTEVVASGAMEIDSLLANAGEFAGQEVTIEGVCTHICKHGGRKIFLMGSDDTQTIRVEGGSVGKFDQKCVNSIVRVTGDLKEQRIDAGCSTEKKARSETANTPEARIADFRAKIADRKAKTGKDYLSFYFVEASSYEIQ